MRRCDLVVVDSIEQARLEAGELQASGTGPGGTAALARAVELKDVLGGSHPGRRDDREVTLFKSLGVGLEDLAAASVVYYRAVETGTGRPLGDR